MPAAATRRTGAARPRDANLATATAMQAPTERHLLRRQRYFLYLLQDVLYQAYQRAAQIGRLQPLPGVAEGASYTELFEPAGPDISRSDNQSLAQAARQVAEGLSALQTTLSGSPPAFQRLALQPLPAVRRREHLSGRTSTPC